MTAPAALTRWGAIEASLRRLGAAAVGVPSDLTEKVMKRVALAAAETGTRRCLHSLSSEGQRNVPAPEDLR